MRRSDALVQALMRRVKRAIGFVHPIMAVHVRSAPRCCALGCHRLLPARTARQCALAPCADTTAPPALAVHAPSCCSDWQTRRLLPQVAGAAPRPRMRAPVFAAPRCRRWHACFIALQPLACARSLHTTAAGQQAALWGGAGMRL